MQTGSACLGQVSSSVTENWGRIQTSNHSVRYLFFSSRTPKGEHKENGESSSSSFTITIAFLPIESLTRIFQDVSDSVIVYISEAHSCQSCEQLYSVSWLHGHVLATIPDDCQPADIQQWTWRRGAAKTAVCFN